MRYFSLFSFVFSVLTSACVSTTTGTDAEDKTKKEELLETKLALVFNQIDQGKPEEAFAHLKPLYRQQPDNPKVLNAYGLVQLALDKPQLAIKAFEKSYHLVAATGTGVNLSSAYLAKNQPDKAITLLKTLLVDKTYEFQERVYHNLGVSYELLKLPQKSKKFYQRALEENPLFYMSAFKLGKIYRSEKNIPEAEKYFKQATDTCPVFLDGYAELAELYFAQQKNASAKSLIQKISDYFLKSDQITERDRIKGTALVKKLKIFVTEGEKA